MKSNVIPFKKKQTEPDPIAVKAHLVQSELERQINSVKSDKEVLEILLLVLCSVCTIIFKMRVYNDPRVALNTGISKIYNDWIVKSGAGRGQ